MTRSLFEKTDFQIFSLFEQIKWNRYRKIDVKMSSDSEAEDVPEFNIEDIFGEDGIQPFQFEPICSDSEAEDDLGVEDSTISQAVAGDSMEWCRCENCQNNPSITKKICCRAPKIFEDDIFDGKKCITETDAFESVCLNLHVLQAAIGTWNDTHQEERNLENINFRFISYKQYISWSFGYLGKKKRKPLPNCAIEKIREKYPDPKD